MKTLFEKSEKGKQGASLPPLDVPESVLSQELARQGSFFLPELTEPEIVQHYTECAKRTFGIDNGFYPLGSCTMKYNPKINDECAAISAFQNLHPLSPSPQGYALSPQGYALSPQGYALSPHGYALSPQGYALSRFSQGALELLYNLEQALKKLTGFARFSLQPSAGAQAEFTALLMIKAWFASQGAIKRRKVLVPDVAHGTNPASAKLVGWEAQEIKTINGIIDVKSVEHVLDDTVACIMVTNPNTLGLFECDIIEINSLVHRAGGLSYLDGANFNALLGRYLPTEQGFDIAHLNLHKTFSTPHGGGGPGAGALGFVEFLAPFMPIPTVEKQGTTFTLNFARPHSVGKLSAFWGNYLVLLRAYAYIVSIGNAAHEVSEAAVCNAHYLKEKLCPPYTLAYDLPFLHEFVISCENIHKETGVRAFDIAKRLMDFGFHPPTIYFPLTVKEALMIEPTETVSREILDEFSEAMNIIYRECYENPEIVTSAPHITYVRRVNEVKAARDMKLRSDFTRR